LATKRFRRTRDLILTLAVTGALVTACGGSVDDEVPSPNDAQATAEAQSEGQTGPVACKSDGETGERVVKDTFLGDVTIPADPQRIISGWLIGTELIDLGVKPVGMLDDYKANATPEELKKVSGVPDIGSITSGVNAEKIISLKPDLVITFIRKDVASRMNVESLEGIAPVVAFEIEEPMDVWESYPRVAEALGCGQVLQDELARLDAGFSAIAEDDKAKIAELGTVAYVEGSAEPATYQIATNKSLVYERLTKAGLKYFAGAPANPERYNEQISTEDLDRLSSANVIFYEADYSGKPTERTKALLDSPAFKTLPAVKAGNLFPYRTPYAYTIAAGDRQIEDISDAVAEAKPAP